MATIFQANNVPIAVGSNSSPTFTFPSGVNEVDGSIQLTLAQKQDPSKSMELRFMVDVADGNGFVENFGFVWAGNAAPNKLGTWPDPIIRVQNGADFAGKTCRVDVISNFATTAGILVSGF